LRAASIASLVDRLAPKRSPEARKRASANIRYFLIATTWHYYRFYFGFSLADTVRCARTAIAQTLRGLDVRDPAIERALVDDGS